MENVSGDGNGQDHQFRFLSGTDATPGSFVGVGIGFVLRKRKLRFRPRSCDAGEHTPSSPPAIVLCFETTLQPSTQELQHPGDGFINVVADARGESQSTGSGVQNTEWTEWVLAIGPTAEPCCVVGVPLGDAPVMWSVLDEQTHLFLNIKLDLMLLKHWNSFLLILSMISQNVHCFSRNHTLVFCPNPMS